MKKLMIAASAALCATVGFSDVQSANVVGYQNQLMTSANMNWFCNTFVPCDKTRETITIGDIKATAGMVESYIVFLDGSGAVNKIYVEGLGEVKEKYYYWRQSDDPADGEGWYLEDDGDLKYNQNNERVIKLGEAFYVKCVNELGDGLVYSGVVDAGSVPLAMANANMNWFGNCAPANVKIGDITASDGMVESYIVFLDASGAVNKINVDGLGEVKEKYYYWKASDDPADGAGWYLEDDGNLEYNQNMKRTILAGESFYVKCVNELGQGISIPSALPKKQ